MNPTTRDRQKRTVIAHLIDTVDHPTDGPPSVITPSADSPAAQSAPRRGIAGTFPIQCPQRFMAHTPWPKQRGEKGEHDQGHHTMDCVPVSLNTGVWRLRGGVRSTARNWWSTDRPFCRIGGWVASLHPADSSETHAEVPAVAQHITARGSEVKRGADEKSKVLRSPFPYDEARDALHEPRRRFWEGIGSARQC